MSDLSDLASWVILNILNEDGDVQDENLVELDSELSLEKHHKKHNKHHDKHHKNKHHHHHAKKLEKFIDDQNDDSEIEIFQQNVTMVDLPLKLQKELQIMN
jgi:transcription initiation factor TFIIIB Brf1 subunit/transcription initiation factor TFIIB